MCPGDATKWQHRYDDDGDDGVDGDYDGNDGDYAGDYYIEVAQLDIMTESTHLTLSLAWTLLPPRCTPLSRQCQCKVNLLAPMPAASCVVT